MMLLQNVGDIYKVYEQYCNDDRETYDRDNTDQIMQKGSFRLGPNNRATHLFGGMFGLNNGYCHDIGYYGTFTFDDNAVGLIGGIAGRQARGALYNVYSQPSIAFTSAALLNDVVNVNNTNEYVVSANCIKKFGQFVDTIVAEQYTISVDDDQFNIEFSAKPKKDDTNSTDTHDTIACSAILISDTTPDKYAISSISARYVTNISAKDGYIMPDVFGNTYTSARVFQLIANSTHEDSSNCKLIVSSDNLSEYTKDSSTTAELQFASLGFVNTYCVATYDDEKISQLAICTTDKNVYSGDALTLSDFTLVTDNSTKVNMNCSGVLTCNDEYYSAAAILENLQIDIQKTNISDIIAGPYNALFNKNPTSAIKITLAPLFHMGGVFGEYVVTDFAEKSFTTLVDDFTKLGLYDFEDFSLNNVYADCSDKTQWIGEMTAVRMRQYNSYNTISCLAADLSIDTMNKSNTDLLSAYCYTSANAQQKLKFNDIYCNTVRPIQSNLCVTDTYIRYINYTPDAMPAVIVSEPHGADHSKGKTHEPNFGITWLDQLFFSRKCICT